MYPGLPEYLNPRGRGMYPYLTGSASWYLLTLITQVFGVRGYLGDLVINPALDNSWFDKTEKVSIRLPFAGRLLQIVIHKPQQFDPDESRPVSIKHNGITLPASPHENGLLIPRHVIQALAGQASYQLDVLLDPSHTEKGT